MSFMKQPTISQRPEQAVGFQNPQKSFFNIAPTHWWTCGVFSLHHSALVLGVPISFDQIQQLRPIPARIIWVEKEDIFELAKMLGLHPADITSSRLKTLRSRIDKALGRNCPVILGVENDRHWVVVGSKCGANYICIDSAGDDVFSKQSWAEIEGWIDKEEDEAEFEAIVIQPMQRKNRTLSLVPVLGGLWRRFNEDADLAEEWGNYLYDLRANRLFRPKSQCSKKSLSGERFFEHYRSQLRRLVIERYEDDEIDSVDIDKVIRNFRIVVRSHSLFIEEASVERAMARLPECIYD